MFKSRSAVLLLGVLSLSLPAAGQEIPNPRDVDLTAPDGAKLKATYFSAGKPGPGVLLLHQCGKSDGESRHNWDELAPRLAASGINVLTFDYRGHGESDGTPADSEVKWERELRVWPGDIDAALAYLESQPGVNREMMGAGGSSCGGKHAVEVARRHPEIKTLVAMSTPMFLHMDREFIRQATKIPIFIAVTSEDVMAAHTLEWLYRLSPNPGSQFVRHETGGHGVAMFKSHKELVGMIVDWYVQTLIKTPGSAPVTTGAKTPPPSILDEIDAPGGAKKVSAQLAEARKKYPTATLFDPWLVNMLGYAHIREGDRKGAIEIMKLNVAAYPISPGWYDSLADTYLEDGQANSARETTKKELELLASDTLDSDEMRKAIRGWAEDRLKQLGDKPQ